MAKFESSYVLKDKAGKEEAERLDRQHEFINILTNGEYLPPSVPTAGLVNIADVATGTGIWLKELSEQLDQEGGPARSYTGFDLTLAHAPASYPENFKFVEHNLLERSPEAYLGTFDVVHLRLLIAALKKSEIEPAVENLITLLKPGGYLLWDEWDKETTRTVPPNDIANKCYANVAEFGSIVGFDQKIPYTIAECCEKNGLHVSSFKNDSLENDEMIKKTRNIAQMWSLDAVRVLAPIYLLGLKKVENKEEAKIEGDKIVEELREAYEGGVTPGVTMVRVLARKP